jgi:hypothetical protein
LLPLSGFMFVWSLWYLGEGRGMMGECQGWKALKV